MISERQPGRHFMLRLPHNCDLEPEITRFVADREIRAGQITCVGALYSARLGFYDHEAREYRILAYDHALEISAGVGNISVRDGRPFVHLHVALTDERGNTTGGHVMEGTRVIACEATVVELTGDELVRTYDEETGLYLWTPGG